MIGLGVFVMSGALAAGITTLTVGCLGAFAAVLLGGSAGAIVVLAYFLGIVSGVSLQRRVERWTR